MVADTAVHGAGGLRWRGFFGLPPSGIGCGRHGSANATPEIEISSQEIARAVTNDPTQPDATILHDFARTYWNGNNETRRKLVGLRVNDVVDVRAVGRIRAGRRTASRRPPTT